MRTLLMVLMIAGMMSTVGVYAAGFGSTPTTKTLAGSGDEPVSALNTGTVELGWTFTADLITGVTAGGATYTASFSPADTTNRTETMAITGTEASVIGTAKVVINSQ